MKKILFSLLMFSLFFSLVKAETPYDFDGDGKTDFGIIRDSPTSDPNTFVRNWYINKSNNNSFLAQQWGSSINGVHQDLPRPFDYDGDGKTDFAVVRLDNSASQNIFYILNSSNNTLRVEYFGTANDNTLSIGDYDGDGKADLCVWRQASPNYLFIYKGSLNNPNGNLTYVPWGNINAVPYPGDFDGDGKMDFCVRFRASSLFVLLRSSDGGVEYIQWGATNDFAHPGDYDGDNKTDFCVRRSDGTNYLWYILERDGGGTGANPIIWGISNPSIAFDRTFGGTDFDGDGKDDIGIYRFGINPNIFYIRKSADGGLIAFPWGNGVVFADNLYYIR